MSNASEPEESVNSCARCRRDATQTCNGCYQAPDAFGERIETTWYCSSDCQIKDRSRHKLACSAAQGRKSLYRAGATAQLAFYRYREKFFDLGISRVEKKGNDLYLYEGGPNEMDELPLSWEFFSNEEDKLSGLTYLTCGNSLGFVHVLMEIMLPDLLLKIARVDYTARNYHRRVIMVSHDGYHNDNTESNHCIIQVTLKNEESYAIDITGAQYGHYDAVIPWDLYVKSRVDRIEKMNPLRNIGECKKRISKKSKGRARTQEEQFAEVFVSAAKSWQVQYGPFEAMLKTKEENFKRKQAGLLDCIEEAVKRHKKEMEVETLQEAEVSEGFNQ